MGASTSVYKRRRRALRSASPTSRLHWSGNLLAKYVLRQAIISTDRALDDIAKDLEFIEALTWCATQVSGERHHHHPVLHRVGGVHRRRPVAQWAGGGAQAGRHQRAALQHGAGAWMLPMSCDAALLAPDIEMSLLLWGQSSKDNIIVFCGGPGSEGCPCLQASCTCTPFLRLTLCVSCGQDMAALLESGTAADMTFKVEDEEFQVHRIILQVRAASKSTRRTCIHTLRQRRHQSLCPRHLASPAVFLPALLCV